jgi:hypothetical protein
MPASCAQPWPGREGAGGKPRAGEGGLHGTCGRSLLLLAPLLLGLGAGGCDRKPEFDHLERILALCQELAAQGAGAAEAEAILGGPPQLLLCASDLPPISGADHCPTDGTPVCIRVWAYRALHENLCGGTACSYGCELRAPEGAPEATCAVRFFDGAEWPGFPPP